MHRCEKRVLMLNASYVDEPLIKALKKLGCFVITTGYRSDFKGHKYADKYIKGDFSDKELMLKIAKDEKVDAVCPCGSDFGVITAAYVSEKLGFKGQDSYETTLILHQKDKFKQYANTKEWLNTPKSEWFEDVEAALDWAKDASDFPLIVKPVDLASGSGVRKVRDKKELIDGIGYAFMKSKNKHIVIEPFIEGTEHAICTFLINKKVAAYCTNDENTFVNPYRIEVARFPASHKKEVEKQLIEQIEKMAEDLNLEDGIFHVQYIVKNDVAYIIECMRRVLGNGYSIPASDALGGFDWEYWIAKTCCGYGSDMFPTDMKQSGFYSYRALFAPQNGYFSEVCIDKTISPFVYKQLKLHESGYQIENNVTDAMGVLFMKFSSISEMRKIMIDDYAKVQVKLLDS